MREFEGVNELHRPDSSYNKKVREAIQKARGAKYVDQCIDLMRGTKTLDRDTLEGIDRDKPEFVIEPNLGREVEEREDEER